jgi:arylsulfatase
MIGPHGPYCPDPEFKAKFVRGLQPKLDRRHCRGGGKWYEADGPKEVAALRDRYDAEIAEEDAYLGMFLARLDAMELPSEPLVVFTSDHGEAFGEHGRMEHGNNLFNEEIHVPLIFRGPGVPVGRRDDVVGLHDVAPTVLALAGVEVPDAFEGVDLFDAVPEDRPILLREFEETAGDVEFHGVVVGGLKAFWDDDQTKRYLYPDWSVDAPGSNRAAERPELLERLIELSADEDAAEMEDGEVELDEDTKRRLEALGYLEPSAD